MTSPPDAAMARAWGIQPRYQQSSGEWSEAPPSTVPAILDSMGATADSQPPAGPRLVEGPGRLTLEDGTEIHLEAGEKPPPDLPFGYHRWTATGSNAEVPVISSPRRCPPPGNTPAWGWALQLYALRSQSSWGIGDLGDLREINRWSANELGSGLVLVNPLHAAKPTLPQGSSPYYPSSRRFRNPLYIRVEDVPGAGSLEDLERAAAAGHALNGQRLIDRDEVFRLKMGALNQLWSRFGGDEGFESYRAEEGDALFAYATFCVLCEHYGPHWPGWPERYRHPDRPEVGEFRAANEDRARFHEWLQWLVDAQLQEASAELSVVHDLAVGFEPEGADAWMWQDVMASGMSVGAPPDEFNTSGQDWGLPPFDPWRLQAAGYQPFIETIRASLRHAGGIRLDHVMGLFRLFWVPHGTSPAAGAYVRYPATDLLDIVALESHRAGAFVVGEDLGTVEDDVRRALAERGVLSYRLLWFEEKPPPEYPVNALAAVTTHDLPTVAGMWTGSDLEDQRRAGTTPNEQGANSIRNRLVDMLDLGPEAPVDVVVASVYRALATSPSMLVTATLDDALAVPERPNMPGTLDTWPNWSLALPATREAVQADPRVRAVAGALGSRR